MLTQAIAVLVASIAQLGPGPCQSTATWPQGPLHTGLPYHALACSRNVYLAQIDVVSLADPGVNVQVTAFLDEPGTILFALPPGLDPGKYELTAHLFPLGECPIVDMPPAVFDVE